MQLAGPGRGRTALLAFSLAISVTPACEAAENAYPVGSIQGAAAVTFKRVGALICGGKDRNGTVRADAALVYQSYASYPVQKLSTPRWKHGAAVLTDGRVLVFGGRGADGADLASTEIFDPETKTWTRGPTMNEAREAPAFSKFHGGVLVAGGVRIENGRPVPLKSAEYFDEGLSRWLPVPEMTEPRAESGAALLDDGTVLIAGGVNGAGPLRSAIRFDPEVKRWRAEPPLPRRRRRHSLVSLPSGAALLAGGLDDTGQPDLQTLVFISGYGWTPGPKLNAPRVGHAAAVMPGGIVLLAGGESPAGPLSSSEQVDIANGVSRPTRSTSSRAREHGIAVPVSDSVALLLGGASEDAAIEAIPISGVVGLIRPWAGPDQTPGPAAAVAKSTQPLQRWDYGDRMPSARGYLQAAVVGRKFVILAPKTESQAAELLIYDPASRAWSKGAPPPDGRLGAAAVGLGGKAFFFGGYADGKVLETTLVYELAKDRWAFGTPMHEGRMAAAATALDERIYVIGGERQGGGPLSEVAVYDTADKSWEIKRPLPLERSAATAAAAFGKVYVFGGRGPNPGQFWNVDSRTAWAYDPIREDWQKLPAMPSPLSCAGASVLDNKIYLVGGTTFDTDPAQESPEKSVTVFDPASAQFTETSELNEPRSCSAVGTIAGALYAAGGGPDEKASVETWSPGRRDLGIDWLARFKHRAPLHPDDAAIIIGVADYKALPRADFADLDARAYVAAVKALGVPDENVVSLVGDRASLADVAKYTEEWLPKHTNPKSRVYFVFSGHGAPDTSDSSPFLMPWDGDASFVRSTGYPLNRLYASLGKLPAREIIAILDSCFSGAGGRSVLAAGVRPLVHVAAPARVPSKLTIFTAAEGSETAGALNSQAQGLFSYFLLDGLSGAADSDGDGHVTAAELHQYARRKVELEARAQGREQTPTLIAPDRALRLY